MHTVPSPRPKHQRFITLRHKGELYKLLYDVNDSDIVYSREWHVNASHGRLYVRASRGTRPYLHALGVVYTLRLYTQEDHERRERFVGDIAFTIEERRR